MSLWEYREAMQKARVMGKVGTNQLALAELIRQQRQIECESRALNKAVRRSRERNSALKDLADNDRASQGLRPVDTGETTRPMFKVERW